MQSQNSCTERPSHTQGEEHTHNGNSAPTCYAWVMPTLALTHSKNVQNLGGKGILYIEYNGGILFGGFCPGGLCPGGFCPRGIMSGGILS